MMFIHIVFNYAKNNGGETNIEIRFKRGMNKEWWRPKCGQSEKIKAIEYW